jgi:hypothetical protein
MMRTDNAIEMTLCVLTLIVGCTRPPSTHDTVDALAREYGVPRERVIEVARAHGVNPDLIGSFGSDPFPLNYYQYQVRAYEATHGKKPPRSWFDSVVKGHVARCESGKYDVNYLFYTDRVHLQWFSDEIALAVVAGFDYDNPDQEAAEYHYADTSDLRDESVNPPDDDFWDNCIRSYRSLK